MPTIKSVIKYGILGTGRIASRMVPYIRESANSDVYAVAASANEKAAAFAGKFNIQHYYGDYVSLLKDDSIDAVYIALPNSLHFEFCKQALEHGKHVLCEKPFVLESGQIDILETISKKNNLKTMECFWYRFHPLVDRVISCVKQDLGAPLGFYSTFSFANASESDIRWDPRLGGGALYDLMCYHLDALNYIFTPDLSQLSYIEAFSRHRNGVDANVYVEALFSDKFQVCLSSSIDRPSINRTTIVGTDASLVIPELRMFPDIKESFFYLMKDGQMQKIGTKMTNAYVRMVQAFSDAIINGSPVPITARESKKNMVLLERIKAGMRTEMADRISLFQKAKRKMRNIF